MNNGELHSSQEFPGVAADEARPFLRQPAGEPSLPEAFTEIWNEMVKITRENLPAVRDIVRRASTPRWRHWLWRWWS